MRVQNASYNSNNVGETAIAAAILAHAYAMEDLATSLRTLVFKR